MKVLVCGGRTWGYASWKANDKRRHLALRQRKRTFDILDRINHHCHITLIIHGDSRGADRVAEKWALQRCVEVCPYPAAWDEHGKAAGPRRNQQMIDEGGPSLVVAFPGGVGTSDMIGRAYDADINVLMMAI